MYGIEFGDKLCHLRVAESVGLKWIILGDGCLEIMHVWMNLGDGWDLS